MRFSGIISHLKEKRGILFCESGVAMVEFCIIVPILLVLATGIIETTRYMLTIQKLEKTIILRNNIVTQHSSLLDSSNGHIPISNAEMAALMLKVPSMLSPYSFGSKGLVIITDIKTGANAAKPVINWQYCGGGTLSATSKLGKGATGSTPAATLPSGFSMIANEEIVIGEIFYQYTPLLHSVIPSTRIYRTAIFVPRFETLAGLSSNCP
ncbi:MAG TPA: TadE/TadG family type IV pilus assembly protein [Rickettsiales bacterium]|nr:TadE/TadG family type IV pilus assembly protein [Rickettsiales bacterium]